MKYLIFMSLAFLPAAAIAGILEDKSPAYFVDRYGVQKSSKNVSSVPYIHVKRGGVQVKGQFSTREFHKGDLTVHAVFFLPSLQPASVRLQLKQKWTREQVEAALVAYGGSWTPVTQNGIVDFWTAPDGSLAINMLTWVEIQSKTIVDEVAKNLADKDAKRKAVPKF